MKLSKRLTALVLAMALLMTLAAPGAWITTVHATAIDLGNLDISQTNPLYDETAATNKTIGSSAHTLNSIGGNIGAESPKLNDGYWNIYGAAEEIRPYLAAHDATFTVDVCCDFVSADTVDDDLTQMVYDVVSLAMAHTGVPNEGDYIQWQWANWKLTDNSTAGYNDEYIYATLEYSFEYYTTPSQEQTVTNTVNQLLEQWDVYDADSYTKLKTIYDYICANVTYDYANLNNNSYDLKYTAYAALMNGTAVCQGYALLLYRMALELGVDARLIPGDTDGNGEDDHGWNIAQIGSLYYNLDSTWDAGYTNYDYFLVCPDNFTDHVRSAAYDTADFHAVYPMDTKDYAPACPHNYTNEITSAPTCTDDGIITYVCSLCGDSYTQVIPADGHDYTETLTEPTCAEAGCITFTCSVCGDSFTEEIPATGHSYGEGVVTQPTCAEDGYTTYTCTICGGSYTDNTVPKLGHNFDEGVVSRAPTCTKTGIMTYTCGTCGKTLQETIPMVDHTYDDGAVTKTPTCTTVGMMTYTCTDCGHTRTEDIAMTAHIYNDGVATAPTCTEKGYTTYTCNGCGTSYQDNFVNATGHSYDNGVVTLEPTCTKTGITTYTCYSCGKTIHDTTDALGHTYDSGVVTVAPTCTETGIMTYTCVHNDDSYTEVIPANGHSWDEGTVIQDPTCTATGVMSYTCTVCNEITTEEIPMVAHNYVSGICSDCGAIQLQTPTITSCYSTKQTSVKVFWTPVENADGYYLWRSTTPDDHSSWTKIKTIKDGTTDQYANQGLTVGVTYYYAIQAYINAADGSVVTSGFSNVKHMPAAIVFDSPYSNSTFRIRLRWQEINGADGYQIWRCDADSEYQVIKTLRDGDATAYSNVDLESGKCYTYKMRAYTFDEEGNVIWGTYSDEISVAVKPEVPTLTAVSTKAGRVNLNWDAQNNASGYQIWMAESADGQYTVAKNVADGAGTSYTKYDLVSGKTYYFKIRAYSHGQYGASYSDFSNVISIVIK